METEFYLELRKKAEKLFPSDEKSSNQYVDGFITKVASILDKSFGEHTLGDSFMARGVAQAAGKALVGGVAAAGFATLMGAVNAVKSHALYNKYLQALDEATKASPILRSADKQKLLSFGNTIFKFAPHVATDSNVLETVMTNAIHGNSLDPMTIKMLTELEGRYSESKGKAGTMFNPKSWI